MLEKNISMYDFVITTPCYTPGWVIVTLVANENETAE
jgi:hypothetical protein